MSADHDVQDRLATIRATGDLADRRRMFDELGASFALPPGTTTKAVDIVGLQAEWVVVGEAEERSILYLHGGGYMSGSIRSHRHVAAAIAASSGSSVLVPEYRLAPEHIFPAALDDALRLYRYLVEDLRTPLERLALVGDSAGGNLVMTLLIAARDSGLPMPACAVCLSPWTDYEASGASARSKEGVDPMITREGVLQQAALYFAGSDSSAAPATILNASLKGVPPLYIQVGSHEVLLDDATRLAIKAAHEDVKVTLEVWPHMSHVFPFFAPSLPDSQQAIRRIGEFVRLHIPAESL